MRVVLLSLLAGAFIAAVPAYAHHSFAATYDERKTITVDSKVVEFLYRNPHCLFSVDSADAQGNVTRWSVEWAGAGRMGRAGVSAETFQPGDHVILTGSPSLHPEDHRLHLKSIVRPSDGFKVDNQTLGFPRRGYRR
jgi:hypothetical protein